MRVFLQHDPENVNDPLSSGPGHLFTCVGYRLHVSRSDWFGGASTPTSVSSLNPATSQGGQLLNRAPVELFGTRESSSALPASQDT